MLVAGKDEHWLAHSELEAMIEDYLDKAPQYSAANEALEPALQRYHGYYHDHDHAWYDDFDEGLFTRVVPPGDAFFLNHSRAPTTKLYQYKASHLKRDQRVSYR